MNALEFLKKHDARPGDVLVFRYTQATFVGIVRNFGDEYGFILSSPEICGFYPQDLTPIALYRAPCFWDPKWWERTRAEYFIECKVQTPIEIELIAKAEPEAAPQFFDNSYQALRAENAELKGQLAKIREVMGD
jgi:hypothetical protein